MNSPEVDNFLGLVDIVRDGNGQWQARCPCRNDDSNPSLSISQGSDGRVLLHCHRGNGCSVDEICTSVGIQVADLMPRKSDISQQRAEKKKEFTKFIKSYDYVDESGNVLFQKVRYVDQDGKKTFRQRRPGGNGEWIYSLGDTPKVLYNLPAVIKAKNDGFYIWVVEGEKDADTLMEAGVIATTMPGGAGKWLDIHTEALRGAYVQIVADSDDPGKKHADAVYRELVAAGCSVVVWQSPIAKDITDHLQAGGTIDSLVELDFGINFDAVVEDSELEVEVSDEEQTLSALIKLLDRDDLSAKQKLAKSSSLISATGTSSVLDPGRLVLWDDFLKESEEDNYDWLIPGLLERNERVIVVAAEGVGKRATIDSVIPTSSGWTTLGDISVGDKVIDRFGNPVNVTYVSPIEPNPDAYRITFSDGNYIDADAEHQWYTETLNEREKRKLGGVRTTKEIIDTLISKRKTKALNHAIPTTKPLNLPEAKLPIPPYTLGAWLGDGTTIDGSICSEDDEILESIRNDGYVVRKRESTPNMYGILGLQVELKEHGLYGNKHIPLTYSRASYGQRLALVQGLMDTDGYVRNDGLCEFSVNHKILAEGFLDLIQTLGIKATMHESNSKLYGRVTGTRYRISFKTELPVCRLKRKIGRLPKKLSTQRSLYRYIVSVEPITPVPMRCISVDGPDNTYLIGDAYIPTHNTMLARQVAICSSCGINPFTYQRMRPVKTLTVDLENPERIIRRTSRSIMAQAMHRASIQKPLIHLYTKPSGLDLLKAGDRALLEAQIEISKPELLVLGPLYKSFVDPGNRTSEAVAVEVAKYFDYLRTVYNVALWLEHHAPLGSSMTSRDLRPFGSAVWSRWPEFGISITPDLTASSPYVYELRHFRGARDERNWPVKITRGKIFPFEVLEFSKIT